MPTVEILKKRVGSSGNYTTIKVTSEMALDDSAEFRRIQNRMNQLLDEEQAKDQPKRLIQMDPAPQVQTRNSNEKTASEKQIRCLQAIIYEQQLSEEEICRAHHVGSIEELPSKTCWKLINDLKKR